jgi:hypothetical protein
MNLINIIPMAQNTPWGSPSHGAASIICNQRGINPDQHHPLFPGPWWQAIVAETLLASVIISEKGPML